jgi:fused signal recognition particle receptor
MTFNWFNRFNQEKAEAEQASEATQPEVEQPEAAEEAAKAEDYLNFAKAAYENIKKRQQQEQDSTKSAPEETPVDAEQASEDTPSEESSPIAELAIEAASQATSSEATEAAPEPTTTEIAVSETDTPVVESVTESVAEPIADSTPLPFWAQAEAEERQARLDRLRSTAIEEEVEPVATVQIEDAAPAIPITLDEGFLWSTEVLAAMGRRAEDVSLEEITWLKRLRQGLDKTRRNLVNQLKAIVGQGPLNDDAVLEIESLLLQADAGVEATDRVIQALQNRLREETLPPEQAIAYLKQILRELLDRPLQGSHSVFFAPEKDTLNIWLMTGVNGAGKTTTIGKLAHIAQKSGYSCLIAAADTFRAAAVEQVKVWGQRSNVDVIANPGQNTDPAAVVFDGIAAAQSRGTELLLVDTAGRLQNKKNLMDELNKIRRIIDRKADNAKVESLLVLDATLGQNGLRQAEVFAEAAQLSGVVLTKLDGTAKGGIALAVVEQLGLPIRFIGAGEGIEDLRPFSSYEFVEALISG